MGAQLEPAFDRVYDTQKIYRQMLDAMARPGKICLLPELRLTPAAGLSKAAAGVAFTLLDSETSVAVLPQNDFWLEYIRLNTGAKAAPLAQAEFIIVSGRHGLQQIMEINRGNLLSPETGSTLIILVDRVAADGPGTCLTLTGPGINRQIQLVITGINPANLERIIDLNQEFPLGVDVFFTDEAGNLAAIPRSSTLHWKEVS